MKKIILLSILFFLSTFIHAQYKSIFGQNSTSWNFWEIPIGASYTDSLFTGKDTLIYGKIYKQVHLNAPNIRLHIIREDTTTGSIFLSDYINGGKEIESMNMTLAVGDSFCSEYVSIDSCYSLSWKKVDSVYYQNGRKVIQFDHWLPTHALPGGGIPVKWKFIEGIGPNNQGGGGRSVGVLLCSYKDGQKVFVNEAGALCVVNTFHLNEKSELKLRVYPNPSSGIIRIDLPGPEVNYTLSNTLGLQIKEGVTYDHEVDIRGIKPGIYILSINYQNQFFQTKILKK